MAEIRITSFHTKLEPEQDRRYRVLVLLNRTDRPYYAKFFCPKCTMPVAELINTEVRGLSDTQDFNNTDMNAVAVRCEGRFDGRSDGSGDYHCRTWYIFSLGAK